MFDESFIASSLLNGDDGGGDDDYRRAQEVLVWVERWEFKWKE
jgi:hypothetical protein